MATWKSALISLSEIAYFLIKNKVDLNVMKEILNDPKIDVILNIIDDVYYALANKEKIKGYDDFNDFLILSESERYKLTLLTFDRKLKEKIKRK